MRLNQKLTQVVILEYVYCSNLSVQASIYTFRFLYTATINASTGSSSFSQTSDRLLCNFCVFNLTFCSSGGTKRKNCRQKKRTVRSDEQILLRGTSPISQTKSEQIITGKDFVSEVKNRLLRPSVTG